MRVAVVSPYSLAVPGGVQQQAGRLAELLTTGGDEAELIAPVDFVSIPANRSRAPVSLAPGETLRTRRRLKAFDVVHVHEPFIPLIGWAALASGRPVVATFHADPSRRVRRLYRATAPLGSWVLRRAVLTAVSPVAASALPPSWGTVRIVPNAIDVGSFAIDVPRRAKRVAFLGRDDPRKGLEVVLSAWPDVRASHPDAELVVMGADRHGTPGVRFLGRVDEEEKRRQLAGSAVFVAPNLGGESFGLIVAEAMAAGCAVVASDLEAFRAVLGGDGRLVPVGDARALADGVVSLLDDPAGAAALGAAARDAVRRFDWPAVTAAYRAAYATAMTGGSSKIEPQKE